MKNLVSIAAIALVSCSIEIESPGEARQVVSSCGYCADVAGRNDVKHLCPASAVAWGNMVARICTTCAADCSTDWCARLDDVVYTDASPACLACANTLCIADIIACSGAM